MSGVQHVGVPQGPAPVAPDHASTHSHPGQQAGSDAPIATLGESADVLVHVRAPRFSTSEGLATLAACPDVIVDNEFIAPRNGIEFYAATERLTGARLILKVLPLTADISVESALLFRNEIDVLAAIGGKNGKAVTPRLAGQCEFRFRDLSRPPVPVLYLVLDRYDQTLHNMIYAPIPFAVRCDLIERTCEAVQEAHAIGLVHRDLKPANVLLDNTTGRAVLADWQSAGSGGALRLLCSMFEKSSGPMTYGTPEFMAPEQALKGVLETGKEADVFSLALLAHQVLVGTHPRESIPKTTAAISDRANYPLRPSKELGRAMRAVFRKAAAYNPSDRYPDAGTFLEDFRRAARGDFVHAWKFVRPLEYPAYLLSGGSNKLFANLTGKITFAGIGLMVGLVAGLWGSRPEPSSPKLPPSTLKDQRPKERLDPVTGRESK